MDTNTFEIQGSKPLSWAHLFCTTEKTGVHYEFEYPEPAHSRLCAGQHRQIAVLQSTKLQYMVRKMFTMR